MFLRVLSTAASLVIGLVALATVDCASTALDVVAGDPAGICSAVDSLGAVRGLWVGIGLGLFAAIALVATWVPAARPGAKRRRLQPESSLNRNLGRLADLTPDEPDTESASEVHVLRMTRRLEAIEASLQSDSTPSREVTEQWMSLLKDVNDLHNADELDTVDFKRINTRLVSLFAGPARQSEQLAATS